MCGIAGIISNNTRIELYEGVLRKMLTSIHHRGPDDEGIALIGNCALGHRRLSIVDLSTGKQPMKCAKCANHIVFNGEIYGYKNIKTEVLEYPFKTQSDTEVILALYARDNVACLKKIPGMYAFALWDEENRTLFAARDRFGEKPFFYAMGESGEFIFASEIKAILASGLVQPRIDYHSLAHYLQHLYVHPYQTIYENIYTLPPAHYLKYRQGNLEIQRYWNLPTTDNSITLDDACSEFKRLFSCAIEKQLVADVPVGAFLSGGLDSSTVVAVASKYKKDLHTFSFGFEDGFNEGPYAMEIANKYRTKHQELTAKNVDIGEMLLKMNEVYDEPFADSSNIPTYLLSKLASQHMKVILTGDGGDELLGGYSWYKSLLGLDKAKGDHLRYFTLRIAARIAAQLKLKQYQRLSMNLQCEVFKRKYDNIITAHAAQNTYFSDDELKRIFRPVSREKLNDDNYDRIKCEQNICSPEKNINDVLKMDLLDYMPGDILVKIDRASMANSLELRAPFLDVDFASFCILLPHSMKLTKDEDKIVLRKAYQAEWTEAIRTRSKQGFGAPVGQWLKRSSVIKLRKEYLNNNKSKIFEAVDYNETQKLAQEDNYKTWILLVTALWFDKNS
ncbi:asparagine synthase (glutamine-hydrolyzing) [Sporomusa sphaeroides]|nr:asparagine synthase (glutamine-hydrolyzing) [Sporomusa sphaeroides]